MPMKRLRTFLLLMILLVLGNGVFAESSKKVSVKRILIIDSFSSLDTWTNELKQGLKSYLNRDDQLLTTFETYELAVRFKPNFQPAPEDIAALKIKLKNSGYDMIVLTNNAAVDLFLSGRLAVPERIPLLVASYHAVAGKNSERNEYDGRGNSEHALQECQTRQPVASGQPPGHGYRRSIGGCFRDTENIQSPAAGSVGT